MIQQTYLNLSKIIPAYFIEIHLTSGLRTIIYDVTHFGRKGCQFLTTWARAWGYWVIRVNKS